MVGAGVRVVLDCGTPGILHEDQPDDHPEDNGQSEAPRRPQPGPRTAGWSGRSIADRGCGAGLRIGLRPVLREGFCRRRIRCHRRGGVAGAVAERRPHRPGQGRPDKGLGKGLVGSEGEGRAAANPSFHLMAARVPADLGGGGGVAEHVRHLRRDPIRWATRRTWGRWHGDRARWCRAGRIPNGIVAHGPVAFGASAAVDHRPVRGGAQPMTDRRCGWPRCSTGASTTTANCARSCRLRGTVLLHLGHRGGGQGLSPSGAPTVSTTSTACSRLRSPSWTPAGWSWPVTGSASNRCTWPRPAAGCGSLVFAGVGRRGRCGHLHRPGRAAPLHDVPLRRSGAVDHTGRGPQTAAGHRPGGRTGRPVHRQQPTGPRRHAATRSTPDSPTATGSRWCSSR